VNPTVITSWARAHSHAMRVLAERPLVVNAMSMSPGRARPESWRTKTSSNEKSLAMAVSAEVLVVSAMAASPGRCRKNLPASSVATCCASAALPPLPHV
jgi:hypothetical protein